MLFRCRYFFYKNMTYTLTQFWFNIYASYSGQRLYDDWYQAFYNLLFTSLPVIVVGLLDQDVSKVLCFCHCFCQFPARIHILHQQ